MISALPRCDVNPLTRVLLHEKRDGCSLEIPHLDIYSELQFSFSIDVSNMAATHQLKVNKIFSVKDHVCVVTGGGTGIGLMAVSLFVEALTLQKCSMGYESGSEIRSPIDVHQWWSSADKHAFSRPRPLRLMA